MLPLFGPLENPFREALARRLAQLAHERIYLGTSSWKYEGWLDQIYTRERYLARGRFSRRRFEQECLAEYAEVFPIVCGDFSFYQFPAADYWRRLFASAPPALRFALKVPEEITVKVWPRHARYGPRAGQENGSFLDAAAFRALFAEPLEPYRERIEVLIFEFGAFGPRSYARLEEFAADLGPFLAALPPGFRYAVEVRNPELLAPRYLDVLRQAGAAHVLNAWTRMPALAEQIAMPGIFTADFTVVRALLRQGRDYERAVQMFSPYAAVQDPNPEARAALRSLIRRERDRRRGAYIFVNNRLEGNAPQTIAAIVAD